MYTTNIQAFTHDDNDGNIQITKFGFNIQITKFFFTKSMFPASNHPPNVRYPEQAGALFPFVAKTKKKRNTSTPSLQVNDTKCFKGGLFPGIKALSIHYRQANILKHKGIRKSCKNYSLILEKRGQFS